MRAMTNVYGFQGMNHEDMKKSYRRLALENHPDTNPDDRDGATERMKILTTEFSYWYARAATDYVRDQKVSEADTDSKKDYYRTRYNDAFISSLEEMINAIYATNIDLITGITVDLVGVFIWIAGIKYDMKDAQQQVRALGFQGSYKYHDDGSKEYMWKWTPMIKRFGADPNIDNIQRKYGAINKNRTKYGMTVSR
jgi:hypothetical protein